MLVLQFLLFGQLCSSSLCLQGDTGFRQTWCFDTFLWTLPVTNLCKCKKNTKEGFQGFSRQRPYFTNKQGENPSRFKCKIFPPVWQLLGWSPPTAPPLKTASAGAQNCHNDQLEVYIRRTHLQGWNVILYVAPACGIRMRRNIVFCILHWHLARQQHSITHTQIHNYRVIEYTRSPEIHRKQECGKNILKGLQSYFFQGGLQGQPLLCPQFFFLHGCFLRNSGQWQPTTSNSLIQ